MGQEHGEGGESLLAKIFNKIVRHHVHDQQGAQTLTTLAKGALGEIQHSGQESDAISAAMKLAAQQRMAKENSPMEGRED